MSCFVVVIMYINESNSFCSHLNPENSNSARSYADLSFPFFSFLTFKLTQQHQTKHKNFHPPQLSLFETCTQFSQCQDNQIILKKNFFKNSFSRVYCSSVFFYKLNNCTVKIVSLNFSGNKQSTKPKPSKKKKKFNNTKFKLNS